MNNIINSNDSSFDRKMKLTIYDVKHMFVLKQHSLWWEEDEKKFVEKYGFSSEHINLKTKISEYLSKMKEREV